jgi:hypothetical protein
MRVGSAVLLAVALASAPVVARGAPATVATSPQPVVLELFTSQGCSSCPPAEALLDRLARDPSLDGAVVPLAFHVDYWNWLGWRDPFSQSAWSLRQRSYAAMTSGRIYTPELIIEGRDECVGSDERCARAAIARYRARPQAAHVALRFRPTLNHPQRSLSLEVDARTDRRMPDGFLRVVLAIVESGLVTHVVGGENADEELTDDDVVRSLTEAFTLPADGPNRLVRRLSLPLARGWGRGALSIAAFLQEPSSLRIRAATLLVLPSAASPP